MFDLDKAVTEIPCPSCKFPNAVSVREVRFGLTIPCRGCKRSIRLVPMDGGLSKAKRMLDNFIADFPKKIEIKL
jgi:hypothetical protein